MTMKIPLNVPPPGSSDPTQPKNPSFDPTKLYRFTWPGQPPRMVAGDELTTVTRGANLDLLNIEEVGDAPAHASTLPASHDSDESTQDRLAEIARRERDR